MVSNLIINRKSFFGMDIFCVYILILILLMVLISGGIFLYEKLTEQINEVSENDFELYQKELCFYRKQIIDITEDDLYKNCQLATMEEDSNSNFYELLDSIEKDLYILDCPCKYNGNRQRELVENMTIIFNMTKHKYNLREQMTNIYKELCKHLGGVDKDTLLKFKESTKYIVEDNIAD